MTASGIPVLGMRPAQGVLSEVLLFNTANITHMRKHKLPKCSGGLHRHCSGAAVSMASPAQDT